MVELTHPHDLADDPLRRRLISSGAIGSVVSSTTKAVR